MSQQNPFIGKFVIVRAKNAGVHAGFYAFEDELGIYLRNSRRLWEWQGAATINQLAASGTSRPQDCKFPEAVPLIRIQMGDYCEVVLCTDEGRDSILGVPIWGA